MSLNTTLWAQNITIRPCYRGNVPTKEGQAAISDRVLAQEVASGFTVRGVYLRRFGYFVDGVAIGTDVFLHEQLSQL